MKTEQSITDDVEKTLNAYESDPVLEGSPFLATRILAARSGQRRHGALRWATGINLRYAAAMLLLLANLATALYFGLSPRGTSAGTLVSALREDLQLDQSSSSF